MNELDAGKPISPKAVLREIAASIPGDCGKNLIVIGSLAVGYFYHSDRLSMVVRTKDVDCLLSPRIEAVQTARAVTEKLLGSGWRFRRDEKWSRPGDADTQEWDLPAVRLHPRGHSE